MCHTCVRTPIHPVSFLATKRTFSLGRVFCLGQSDQHKEYRAPVQQPLAVSHTRRRSPGCHGTRDHLSTPSSSMLGGVFETLRLSRTVQPVSKSSSRKLPQAGERLPSHKMVCKWHTGHLRTLAPPSSQPFRRESD